MPAAPHLFEFMDQSWAPQSLRLTLQETMQRGMSPPFRSFYDWIANDTVRFAETHGFQCIVELGAGTAPITQSMLRASSSTNLEFVVCDICPNISAYDKLERAYPGRVSAEREPVDFSRQRSWPPRTLLVLSACFHHIPPASRTAVLRTLMESADGVLIFEPLRRNIASICFASLSFVPALLLPLLTFDLSEQLRRFFWCWFMPAAPLMFTWDGIVSCLRQWTDAEWKQALATISVCTSVTTLNAGLLCHHVAILRDRRSTKYTDPMDRVKRQGKALLRVRQ